MLCEELRSLGLQAFFEEHYLTKFGRNKPDIHAIYNDVNYFIEGKQKPRKLDTHPQNHICQEVIITVSKRKLTTHEQKTASAIHCS